MTHPTRPLKYVATLNDDALGEGVDPDYELQYIDIGNVDSSGRIHEVVTYRFADAPSRARRRVRDGDVIISCVRTYLQAIAPIDRPADNLIVSTGFAVLRPKVGVLRPGFAKYALREPRFLAEVERRSVGVSYPAINSSDLGAIPIPVPTEEAQRNVERFLDRETASIDTLLVAKQRVLDLLAEKRGTIMATAVTRGLDPKVKLRDSGVPWLGDIPEHWHTERARRLFRERDVRSETGDEELLTVSHLTGVTPRSEKNVNMFEAETNEGYKLCEPGDLVINTLWAWMGAMGIAPVKGIVSPAYNVYEPGPRLAPAYVDSLARLPAFAQEVTRHSKGVWSSRLRLYPDGFFDVYLPVPPMGEQHAIIEDVARETAKLDAVRAATERTIALLKERRAALIAAAVTGHLHTSQARLGDSYVAPHTATRQRTALGGLEE